MDQMFYHHIWLSSLSLRQISLPNLRLGNINLRKTLLTKLSILLLVICGYAQSAEPVTIPVVTPEPQIEAAAWGLMELNSGWVVVGQNLGQRRSPASITKLMANYVIFSELRAGNISLDDQVVISKRAWKAIGSRSFAEVDTTVRLDVLLKGMVIQSGNDASIALAEHISQSEPDFAGLMNRYAREIGLQNSFFVNATGLTEPNHEMTALDILKLSSALIRDFPEYYHWYGQKEFTHNGITQRNRNGLLWKDASVDGLKTGYTDAAGYCLVATANREGQRWIAVVLGTTSSAAREAAAFKLLEYGYKNYEPTVLLQSQQSHGQVEVYGGDADLLELKVAEAANIVVPRGRIADVAIEYDYPEYIEAPIDASAQVGQVRLMLDGAELYKSPLLAISNIGQAGLFRSLIHSIRLRWRKFTEE